MTRAEHPRPHEEAQGRSSVVAASGKPRAAPTGPRRRSQAREAALCLLYEWDLTALLPQELDQRIAEMVSDPEGRAFARALFDGVAARKAEIDVKIHAAALHWRLSRMAFVDRNVLRLGVYELAFSQDTHATVVINEAIELAKRFSTEHSGAFVNGILDRIRLSLAPAAVEDETSDPRPVRDDADEGSVASAGPAFSDARPATDDRPLGDHA